MRRIMIDFFVCPDCKGIVKKKHRLITTPFQCNECKKMFSLHDLLTSEMDGQNKSQTDGALNPIVKKLLLDVI